MLCGLPLRLSAWQMQGESSFAAIPSGEGKRLWLQRPIRRSLQAYCFSLIRFILQSDRPIYERSTFRICRPRSYSFMEHGISRPNRPKATLVLVLRISPYRLASRVIEVTAKHAGTLNALAARQASEHGIAIRCGGAHLKTPPLEYWPERTSECQITFAVPEARCSPSMCHIHTPSGFRSGTTRDTSQSWLEWCSA